MEDDSRKKWVEFCAIWAKGNGQFMSGPIMEDRIADLMAAAQDGPARIWIKPNERKKDPKHPDAMIYIVPPGKRP